MYRKAYHLYGVLDQIKQYPITSHGVLISASASCTIKVHLLFMYNIV